MCQEAIHLKAWIRSEHIFRPGEDVVDKSWRNNAQSNFAVDATESEVVDLMPKRWDIRPFGGVNLNREDVVGIKVEMRRQFKGERRISALVFAEANTIQPNC